MLHQIRRGTIFLATSVCVGFALFGAHTVFAQTGTPASVTKTCGYSGGPTCPSAAVVVTAWQFILGYTYPSESEAGAAFETAYTTPAEWDQFHYCSLQLSYTNLTTPAPSYTDGIETGYYFNVN